MNLEINVRKNDRVVVIAGKDKGKTGRVIEVQPRKGKLLVEGVNVVKRHNKANTRRGMQGGILEREAPILKGYGRLQPMTARSVEDRHGAP